MKYIDADLLRKEIEHRIDILSDVSIKCAKNDDMEMHNYYHGKAISLDELLSFIDSLQQEQPEIDLEKEIEEHVIYMPHGEFASDNELQEDVEWARKEFQHFYELGLRGAADRQRAEEEEV